MRHEVDRAGAPSQGGAAANGMRSGRDRASGRRAPDFFVVGHPKSGTTALYEMLRRHPQIFMPAAKEPWYLARELHHRPPPRPEGIASTLEEYLTLFDAADPEQLIGEASPLYLWSRTAAASISEVQPRARIIAILREPASFLRSLHLQFLESYIETEDSFPRAIALEDERRRGRSIPPYTYWPQALLYSDHVHYVEQLRRFEDACSRDQMLVLIYDDFRSDNEATVRRVLSFLEVDDEAPVEVIEANPTVAVRSQRLHELLHAVSVGRGPLSMAVKASLKALTPRALRREALHATQRLVNRSPSPPDETFMLELRRRYLGEVVALSEYLDRDLLSLWGYDALG